MSLSQLSTSQQTVSRISSLQAKVASLTAQNSLLRSRSPPPQHPLVDHTTDRSVGAAATMASRSRYKMESDDLSLDGTLVSKMSDASPSAQTVPAPQHKHHHHHHNPNKCVSCDLVANFISQNDALRRSLAAALTEKTAHRLALKDALAQLEYSQAERAATQKQMQDVERLLDRYGAQLKEQEAQAVGREERRRKEMEAEERRKDDELARLRKQLMEQFEANKRLVSENAELCDQTDQLKNTVTAMKGRRNALKKEQEEKSKTKVKIGMREDKTTQIAPGDEPGGGGTVEAGVGLDEEGEALLRAAELAAKAMSGQTQSKSTETGPEVEVVCDKCDGKGGLAVSTQAASGKGKRETLSPKSKTPRALKTPKARVILEAKVLQVMYEILEKKILADESDIVRALTATPKKGGGPVPVKADVGMNAFLTAHFTQKFGITGNMAAQQQANFVGSLNVYKQHNNRIQHFLALCGQLNSEVFCTAIEKLYLDVIRATMNYKNYEGTSERLDDGIGQVKLTKKQAVCALLGKEGKISSLPSWDCDFLLNVAGVSGIKTFYEVNISKKVANSGDTIDFDEFANALVSLVLECLERQTFKLKEAFEGGMKDEEAAGLTRDETKEALKKILLEGEEGRYTDEVEAKIWKAATENGTGEEVDENEDGETTVSPDGLVAAMFAENTFKTVVANKNVSKLKLAGKLTGKLSLLLKPSSEGADGGASSPKGGAASPVTPTRKRSLMDPTKASSAAPVAAAAPALTPTKKGGGDLLGQLMGDAKKEVPKPKADLLSKFF
ncbi:hypothetical protein TeGR_g5010 [Tetraparma gracilis]|uniref:Uncharacterized protein n=1 Tax=Tetraparma gracilis TaxID=2962635 RepID=A0ABQ6MXF3_9STRA|nr:hypothetical protein TeGR_g5010 [Tetraparma gracilis]